MYLRSTQTDAEQGDVYVALSDGSRFLATDTRWHGFFCVGESHHSRSTQGS
jgi:hypothetical protein